MSLWSLVSLVSFFRASCRAGSYRFSFPISFLIAPALCMT